MLTPDHCVRVSDAFRGRSLVIQISRQSLKPYETTIIDRNSWYIQTPDTESFKKWMTYIRETIEANASIAETTAIAFASGAENSDSDTFPLADNWDNLVALPLGWLDGLTNAIKCI